MPDYTSFCSKEQNSISHYTNSETKQMGVEKTGRAIVKGLLQEEGEMTRH